jgi:hypothetical protein
LNAFTTAHYLLKNNERLDSTKEGKELIETENQLKFVQYIIKEID